ncbi:MAG: MFS transporter, partial [Halobacteriota archaeon]
MLAHGMVHTYELAIPIFVTIWLLEFSVSYATLGLIVMVSYGLFGVGALPGGILTDKLGSQRLISICLFGMSGSFFLLGFAPNLVVITLALVLWGVAASVYHPAGLSLISKGVEQRGSAFAYHGIAGNLGTGLGPFITAILLIVLDWQTVAIALAIPALIAALISIRIDVDESAAVEAGGDSKASTGVSSLDEFVTESKFLFASGFVLVFVLVMFSGLYYRGTLTFLPDLLQNALGIESVPVSDLLPNDSADEAASELVIEVERLVYAGLLTVGVFGQYAGGKLTDRIPVERGLLLGFTSLAVIALVFLPLANLGIPTLLFGCVLLGFFLFFVQPFYQATVAEYTPAGTRGLSYGFTYLGVFGVGSLGAAVAGFVLDVSGAPALFGVLAIFAFVASAIGLYLLRRGDRPTET